MQEQHHLGSASRLLFTLLVASVSTVQCFAQKASIQQPRMPSANQQIAAAVLPLPPPMREKATVIGYAADMSPVTLRSGSNGMVCTASQPGLQVFDARCYDVSFMPIIRRLQELHKANLKQEEIVRTVDSEIAAKKLVLPDHPISGYRMMGPITAYNYATNVAGKEIESWQSIHVPYRTAAELGLPEEGQVARTLPYVMASGTFWSHVMIWHEDAATMSENKTGTH